MLLNVHCTARYDEERISALKCVHMSARKIHVIIISTQCIFSHHLRIIKAFLLDRIYLNNDYYYYHHYNYPFCYLYTVKVNCRY